MTAYDVTIHGYGECCYFLHKGMYARCIEVGHLRSNHNLKAEKVEHANGTCIHTFMQEVTTLPIPVNRHIICGHSHKIGNPNMLNYDLLIYHSLKIPTH
jgi:hypothetical protein